MTAAAVLDALGDPMRRAILEELAAEPLAVGRLAERLPIGRPAVSHHLKVLKTADLVSETTLGTRHVFAVQTRGLEQVRDYLDRFWSTTLDGFARLAEADSRSEQEQ